MLIEANNVVKAFGAFKAVDDASVSVEEGDILGLIGPNGAGKSTFFNCLTGDLPVTSGSVAFAGSDVTRLPPEERARLGLARTFQVPLTFESMSVLENATIGALILVPLEELSNSYLGGRGAGLTFVVYGAIIVIIARFLPSGLLSLLERRKVRRAD